MGLENVRNNLEGILRMRFIELDIVPTSPKLEDSLITINVEYIVTMMPSLAELYKSEVIICHGNGSRLYRCKQEVSSIISRIKTTDPI
jgi:hypothetical protein